MKDVVVGVISVTRQGDEIAKRLRELLHIELFSKNGLEKFDIKEIAGKLMSSFKAVIFISSTGIAVRSIAPYLKGKDVDPAVIVIDSSCRFVISLAGGHLGGANELTLKIAKFLNALPVITTATDNMGITAPDIIAKENRLIIEDLKKAKTISAYLVEGREVAFIDDKYIIPLPTGYSHNAYNAGAVVYVTHHSRCEEFERVQEKLKLIRRDIVLGIGCRKDFDTDKMQSTVLQILDEYNIDKRSVACIGTAEIKKDEKAIIELAGFLGAVIRIFSIDEIKAIQHKYKGSSFVENTIGVRAVCEPCVELCGAQLLTGKISCEGMTICIGEMSTTPT